MFICEFKINADVLHEKKSVYFSANCLLTGFKNKKCKYENRHERYIMLWAKYLLYFNIF